jgi:alkaline phosphatase D
MAERALPDGEPAIRRKGLGGLRLFVLMAAVVLVGCRAAGAARDLISAAAEPTLLVAVGDVTDSTAVLWLRGESAGIVTVRYGPVAGEEEKTTQVQVAPATDLTDKLLLTELPPSTRYRYRVVQGPAEVAGEFVTAPHADQPASVRFSWSGDLGSRAHCRNVSDGYPIFRTLAKFTGDFFLFVGDTIYADHVCQGPDRVPGYGFIARSVQEYRAKHRYNRSDPGVQDFFRRLSVYAIWDDHEVRNDFSGTVEPLMPAGRQAFLDYFPILPPSEEPARLYRKFRWGSLVELFILDTRQYRRPNGERDGRTKTMLGAAQRHWLIESVSGSTATWKLVVSSVSLSVPSPRLPRDSWSNASLLGFPEENSTGFAVERDSILHTLRERGVKNLVFLAADAHHAELIRHEPVPGWTFYEFLAGPLAASPGIPRPLDRALNPRSLFSLGGIENYGEVAVEVSGLTVRIVDVNGRERFRHTFLPELSSSLRPGELGSREIPAKEGAGVACGGRGGERPHPIQNRPRPATDEVGQGIIGECEGESERGSSRAGAAAVGEKVQQGSARHDQGWNTQPREAHPRHPRRERQAQDHVGDSNESPRVGPPEPASSYHENPGSQKARQDRVQPRFPNGRIVIVFPQGDKRTAEKQDSEGKGETAGVPVGLPRAVRVGQGQDPPQDSDHSAQDPEQVGRTPDRDVRPDHPVPQLINRRRHNLDRGSQQGYLVACR